jgi:protein subunit release factor B
MELLKMETSFSSRRKVLSVTAADCDLQTFRSGGSGGQNQNKRDTGVRFIHRESGGRGEARDERSQLQNKKLAWKRMCESKEFQLWLRRTLGQDAAREAEEARTRASFQISAGDVKIETRVHGRWVETDETNLRG